MKNNLARDKLIEALKFRGAEEIEPDVWYVSARKPHLCIYIEMNDPIEPEQFVNLKIESLGLDSKAIEVSQCVDMQILADDITAMGLGFYHDYLREMITELDKLV